MSRKRFLSFILCLVMILTISQGCGEGNKPPLPSLSPSASQATPSNAASISPASSSAQSVDQQPAGAKPVYQDSQATLEDRVNDLLSRMSLDEKIGQMVQPELSFINPQDVANYFIGSVLSGGGSSPGNKTIKAWDDMIIDFQRAAASTPLGIPIIYGVDAVHGMAKFQEAVVFPHNSGLGAANDPAMMERIGEYTAKEMLLCGVTWNFAPCIAVTQDIRWGRTYESYSENTQRVTNLGVPYIKGLQDHGVVACAKHFFGDGGTLWGTGDTGYPIDRGNVVSSDYEDLRIFLDPYEAAIKSGVRSIMVSFNSLNGVKMHENTDWVQEWLKGKMGFTGFVVSDWEGLQQIKASDYHEQVVKAVNAGIDMLMETDDWMQTLVELKNAVNKDEIAVDRINDAVGRILRVKFEYGLFGATYGYSNAVESTLSEAKQVARKAVSESLVLLKNENDILPLKKNADLIVIGSAANDIPTQCGGWTMDWQGMELGGEQNWIKGTTILQGLKKAADTNGGSVSTDIKDAGNADAVILVLGERPHAEGIGDDASLDLYEGLADPANRDAIKQANETGLPVIAILVSARPRIVTDEIKNWSAFVMAWLPGSEGGGVADVLYGDSGFSGTLSYTWPKSINYFIDGTHSKNQGEILFNCGYGMTY